MTPEPRPDEAFVRNSEVMHSRSGETVVALDMESGDCFSFEGPSRRIWELLETPMTPAELARQLTSEFEVEEDACLRESLAYLARLQAEGLVQRAEAG
jgi:hypothetical protein